MIASHRRLALWGSVAVAVGLAASPEAGTAPNAEPILAELFTSEGCSSCPPADALLADLDRRQPIPGAHIIALSEHVDYWNDLGWADPYSSAAMTERQRQYATRLSDQGVYTPQLVIDGAASFVGSDRNRTQREIALAAQRKKIPVHLAGVTRHDDTVTVTVELPSGSPTAGVVHIAIAEDTAASDVRRGENAGKHLQHVAVARSIASIGSAKGNVPVTYTKTLTIPRGGHPLRLIAFFQDSKSWRILGIADTRL